MKTGDLTMLKRIAAAGVLTATIGGVLLTAGAAQADDTDRGKASNVEILPIQTCRGIDAVGIGAALRTVLGASNESGDCVNGPAVSRSMVHATPK